MFLNGSFTDIIKRRLGDAYKDIGITMIDDDGGFYIDDRTCDLLNSALHDFNYLPKGNEIADYNTAITLCYQHFFSPQVSCCGISVPYILVNILKELDICKAKITHPGKLWRYFIDFINGHEDVKITMASKKCPDDDFEIYIYDSFKKELEKILSGNE